MQLLVEPKRLVKGISSTTLYCELWRVRDYGNKSTDLLKRADKLSTYRRRDLTMASDGHGDKEVANDPANRARTGAG